MPPTLLLAAALLILASAGVLGAAQAYLWPQPTAPDPTERAGRPSPTDEPSPAAMLLIRWTGESR